MLFAFWGDSVSNCEKTKSPNILCVGNEEVTPTNQPSLLCSRFWSKKVQLLFAFWGDSVLNYEKQSRSANILSLEVSNQPSLLSSPIIKRDDDDDDCDDDDDNDYCEDTIRDIGNDIDEDDDDYFEDIIGDIDNDIDEDDDDHCEDIIEDIDDIIEEEILTMILLRSVMIIVKTQLEILTILLKRRY